MGAARGHASANLVLSIVAVLLPLRSASTGVLASHHYASPRGAPRELSIRLRGGEGDGGKVADPSGIWQTFQKSSGVEWEGDDDGPYVGYGLAERGPCAWGKGSVSRRTQKLHLRLTCNETIQDGETLLAIGERMGLPGYGNPEGYWEGVKIPMAQTDDFYEARAELPPGTYK